MNLIFDIDIQLYCLLLLVNLFLTYYFLYKQQL